MHPSTWNIPHVALSIDSDISYESFGGMTGTPQGDTAGGMDDYTRLGEVYCMTLHTPYSWFQPRWLHKDALLLFSDFWIKTYFIPICQQQIVTLILNFI